MTKNILTRYPEKRSIQKIVSDNYINSTSCKDFLKSNGILVFGNGKEDLALLTSEFFFSRKDYLYFKELMLKKDTKTKSSSINFSKDKIEKVKETLFQKKDEILDINSNMKITNLNMENNEQISFTVDYIETKAGKIDLLDEYAKSIPVNIVSTPDGNLAFDFSYVHSSEANKTIKAITFLSGVDNKFNLSIVSLSNLKFNQKIELFDRFFTYNHTSFLFEDYNFNIEEIKSLKIKKNPEISKEDNDELVETHELKGINSAIVKE